VQYKFLKSTVFAVASLFLIGSLHADMPLNEIASLVKKLQTENPKYVLTSKNLIMITARGDKFIANEVSSQVTGKVRLMSFSESEGWENTFAALSNDAAQKGLPNWKRDNNLNYILMADYLVASLVVGSNYIQQPIPKNDVVTEKRKKRLYRLISELELKYSKPENRLIESGSDEQFKRIFKYYKLVLDETLRTPKKEELK
jgi:hypothetical protein